MESALDYYTARALLEWQVDLGVTEAMLDAPLNRYEAPKKQPKPVKTPEAEAPIVAAPKIDPVVEAKAAVERVKTLDELKAAMAAFDHCELKKGARNLVFSDGNPAARVMIIGEAPGRDEDRQGKPFVGRAGQLLDRMFEAIEMGREAPLSAQSIYITNVLPWRPPQNRDPLPEEIAMLGPFLQRHVEIVAPDVIVLMGNISCQAVLGRRGITRLRGNWQEAFGKPVMPMFHPAYLLRQPGAKREAWADLLSLQAKLRELA
ncbi:uracil-DNA glycosylase [Shimia sp. CNT1-13L.2]|jgi:DNA polymerase|uniref:uracil-DNA glycosylase n=1 Tax=Shimia sp. CNT1-13L.2 TaxID=2959663 RepID=UPI0020CFC422|nr:uracil-DNA glycosylase [Shimia sp. CNT1-13L.2]MCP9480651.1 uracil-DNA glycosylase [Shimia sp. CNT1-13L.2]